MAKVTKKVAVVVKDQQQLAEGLRSTAGLLLDNHEASLFVLDQAVPPGAKFKEDFEFLKEMEGGAYTNVRSNARLMEFELLTPAELVQKLRSYDIIVPF